MKLYLVSLAMISLAAPSYAQDVSNVQTYDCTLQITEVLPIVRVLYTPDPVTGPRYQSGVPQALITSQTELTPGFFNGDFSKLTYHGLEPNKTEGYATYTLAYSHPEVPFSFSTLSRCGAISSRPYGCELSFDMPTWVSGFHGAHTSADTKDGLNVGNGHITAFVNAFTDSRDQSLSLVTTVTRHSKFTVGVPTEFDQGWNQTVFESLPKKIHQKTTNFVGYIPMGGASDKFTPGVPKYDAVDLKCERR